MITTLKTCFKCGAEKPLLDYYAHSGMSYGHLNKCKVCTKEDSRRNREENLERVREYDRNRPNKKERNEKVRDGHNRMMKENSDYAKSTRQRKTVWAIANEKKKQANTAIGNAVRDGKIYKPSACQNCGITARLHGHHWSYEKEHWLSVIWLCPSCHGEEHAIINQEVRNAERLLKNPTSNYLGE